MRSNPGAIIGGYYKYDVDVGAFADITGTFSDFLYRGCARWYVDSLLVSVLGNVLDSSTLLFYGRVTIVHRVTG